MGGGVGQMVTFADMGEGRGDQGKIDILTSAFLVSSNMFDEEITPFKITSSVLNF